MTAGKRIFLQLYQLFFYFHKISALKVAIHTNSNTKYKYSHLFPYVR